MLHVGALILKIDFEKDTLVVKTAGKPLVVKIKNDVNKQIVQSENSDSIQAKDKSFLSDKTRSFDRQTRSRVTDIFHKGQRKSGGGNPVPKDLKLSDLGAEAGQNPFQKTAKQYNKIRNGDSGQDPSQSVSSTNDYIQDIPLGDLTHLNTVEYKYYGFYHRIRQKLEQFWGRSLYAKAEQLASQGRRVPATEELITALLVTLNHQGKVIEIKIKGSSGIKELDEAAIESFNDAGPFPNPPKDLIVNGRVTLEWGFVVKS
jgi:protein TonB